MPKPGRPALPPEERRQTKGVSLAPATWAKLAELAAERGTTQAACLEEMIMNKAEYLKQAADAEASDAFAKAQTLAAWPAKEAEDSKALAGPQATYWKGASGWSHE